MFLFLISTVLAVMRKQTVVTRNVLFLLNFGSSPKRVTNLKTKRNNRTKPGAAKTLIVPPLAWIDYLIFGCKPLFRLISDETLALVSPFAHILIFLKRVEN